MFYKEVLPNYPVNYELLNIPNVNVREYRTI